MAKNITKQNELIQRQQKVQRLNGNVSKDVTAESLKDHAKKMSALQEELIQYNSIATALDSQLTKFAQWQTAKSSANEGDAYLEMYQNLVEAEEARNKLLTGTDEFKSFTSLISQSGLSGTDVYDEVIPTIRRYFTQGTEGLNNFLEDLVEEGFIGALEDGRYEIGALNVEEIAKQLGVGTEVIEALLGRLNDYNFGIVYAKNELEANAKIIETQEQLMSKYHEQAEAWAKGDWDAYEKASDEIDILIGQQNDLYEIRDSFSGSQILSEEDYNAELKYIQTLQNELKSMDDDSLEYYATLNNLIATVQNLGGSVSGDGTVQLLGNYAEYAEYATSQINKLAESMPDLSDVTDESVLSYETGLEKLKKLTEGMVINLDFKIDENTSLADMYAQLTALKNLKIDSIANPEAQKTLDQMTALTENELRLRLVMNAQDMTLQQLANLSDEEMQTLLFSMNIKGEDAEAFMEFLKNKNAEMPVTVKLDETSINGLTDALSSVMINAKLSPKVGGSINEEISNLNIDPILLTANIDNIQNMLTSMETGLFGNVDLTNREILTWTQENLEKWENIINQYGGAEEGMISTVLGSSDYFYPEINGEQYEFSVAFTPLLQTGTGEPMLLDRDTMNEYINACFDNAFPNGEFDYDLFMNLDKEGFCFEIDGVETRIHDMIAGLSDTNPGNSADIIGEIMHLYETGEHEEAVNKILSMIDSSVSDYSFSDATIKADKNALIESIRDALKSEVFRIKIGIGRSYDETTKRVGGSSDGTGSNIQGTAFANGTKNGAIAEDQKALVNEVGHEGIIRNGIL